MDKKKILFADDEPEIIKVVSYLIKDLGYDVVVASNGKEAWDLVQKEKPDLVILDYNMPLMSGDQVCEKIKNDDALKQIPVLFMTASIHSEMDEFIKSTQADDYLVKPFETAELFEKIQKLTASVSG